MSNPVRLCPASFRSLDRMPHEFDECIIATPMGDGMYDTPVIDRWDINGNANGGYLLALVANAMRAECGRAHPVSVSMHYLSPAPAGPAQTRTQVVKSGRRFATVAGALVRDGRELVRSIATFGDIDASHDDRFVDAPMPDMPPFDECPARPASSGLPMGLMTRLDMRIHPDDTGFGRGEPKGEPHMRGWFAFADGRPSDPLSLLLTADAFPPVMFNLFGVRGWVPTVEMTVHLRAVPAPGPILCEFRSRVVQGGLWEEDGVMWDCEGTVVAMSRQLALAPLAPPQ